MENPTELPTALEVINATNLNYFNNTQKAEFFTLKAIVLSRLGMIDEANRILLKLFKLISTLPKGGRLGLLQWPTLPTIQGHYIRCQCCQLLFAGCHSLQECQFQEISYSSVVAIDIWRFSRQHVQIFRTLQSRSSFMVLGPIHFRTVDISQSSRSPTGPLPSDEDCEIIPSSLVLTIADY